MAFSLVRRATSSASGSRWSRSSGRPGSRKDRVVEHAVGRSWGRAWRIEIGGADRSDHLRILPHRRHDAAHELVPADRALVGDVMDAGPALDGEPAQHRRQIGGERRAAALVVDERQRRRARRRGARRCAPCSNRARRTPTTCARPSRPGRPRCSPASFDRPYTDSGFGASRSWYGRSSVPSNT